MHNINEMAMAKEVRMGTLINLENEVICNIYYYV